MARKEFIDLTQAISSGKKNPNLRSGGRTSSILKSHEVKTIDKKVRIGGDSEGEVTVIPIADPGGFIEGLRIVCKCGEMTEVYFEYENPAPPDSEGLKS